MKTSSILLAAVTATTFSIAGAQAAPTKEAIANAERMDAAELVRIYSGKTWRWGEGAGYFDRNRRFVAWSGSGDAATYAEGRWSVTKTGRMCFEAVWRLKGSAAPQKTCFGHRKTGDVMYQRKEPSGDWYVFKGSRKTDDDEYNKLREGDTASKGMQKIKARIRVG